MNAVGCRTVHVVDDHALSRKLMRTVLSHHGYAVVLSEGPGQARTQLLAAPPDLVLMDLQMPGESGWQLLAWMREQPSLAGVPVICISASMAADSERTRAAGFAQLLAKPITPPARLLGAVRAALGDDAAP